MALGPTSGPTTSYYAKFAEVAETSVQTGVLDIQAGEVIQGHRVVISGVDGLVYKADNTNISHYGRILGITDRAYVFLEPTEVISSGVVIEPSFNLTPGLPIFFDNLGMITQTPPTTGFLQNIGHAINPTTIVIEMKTPILL